MNRAHAPRHRPLLAAVVGAVLCAGAWAAGATASAAATVTTATATPTATARTTSAGDTHALARMRAAFAGQSVHLFGLSPDGNSSGIGSVPPLSTALRHRVDIVNIFVGWGEPFPTASVNRIVAIGSVPELSWEPWNYRDGVHQPDVADSRIAGGAYDGYLRSFATAARQWGNTFLLRFAHEMNGNWYPWAATTNGNTPRAYVAAWRHVHSVVNHTLGATRAGRVLWVWCPNVEGPTPIARVFPGRGYVNVLGLDGYNFGTTNGGWRSAPQIFRTAIRTVRSLAPHRPVLINETGSSEHGGSKPSWLTELFRYLRNTSAAGVVYSEFGTTWPLTTSPAAESAARAALRSF